MPKIISKVTDKFENKLDTETKCCENSLFPHQDLSI